MLVCVKKIIYVKKYIWNPSTKHISCECKCNSNQWWNEIQINNDKC